MAFEKIVYEKKGRIAYITINRPEARNALDGQTNEELYDAWTDFRDDPEVWVAILTGAGDRAFCSGADLVSMAEGRTNVEGLGEGRVVPFGGMTKDFHLWKPTIAAINGYCLAGGLEIALACDIRVAADNAQFGAPEPKWAIMPGAGGTQRLPRAVPRSLAMKLLLTGDRINALEALQWGLVTDVVPLPELITAAEKIAESILENGPLAVRIIKETAMRGWDMSLDDGLALESYMARVVGQSEDAKEGPRAFAEKRKPEYKGR
ncbi:MAG TPA: enoyl-CoA hydratase-related protein [Dehalococcoidia bacterium]|nr:enoyl-CoA hydratase-related protein [Dehalococcoidia bacterium]